MRVVGEIPHPEFKITLFHWNNKYLIKLENGLFEQTYKVRETDVLSENDLPSCIDQLFLTQASALFTQMAQNFFATLDRNQ